MTAKYLSCYVAFLTIVWLGLLSEPALGQSANQSAQQAIEKTLSEKGTFEFTGTPLSELVSLLRDRYDMNVIIDNRALKEKEIDAESPVSIKLKDVTVRSALDLAIRPLGLSWTIYCEALVISTPSGIQTMQYSKVYDITDLGTVTGEQGKTWEEPEALIDAITACVDPASWEDAGGRGTIQLVSAGSVKLLVVSQDYRAQRQIANLLTAIYDAVKQHAPAARERTAPGR